MRICFFSDIHGVPETLELFLKRAAELEAERLVFLGDALYHGPRNGVPVRYDPVATAKLLNAHKEKIVAVRGNCDSEVDQMMLDFPIMADYAQLMIGGQLFFLTHGHRWNASHLPPLPTGAILVHGHTHIPENRPLENGLKLFNPGSISLPKGGSVRSFGLYDGKRLEVLPLES